MQAVWLKGCKTAEQKEQRRKEVLAYRNAFDALAEILKTEFKPKNAVRDYSSPNWMAEQIAVNEYNAVLEDIFKLIKLEK